MAHDIIDNSKVKLAKVLREKISVSRKGHFAVGWFFLTGLKEIKEEIEGLEKLEILIGSKTNKETAEAILLASKYEEAVNNFLEKNRYLPEYQIERLKREESKALLDRISFIEPTRENIEFIRWFWEKIREKKIEIKIYPYEPLHAKLYLLDFKDSRYGKGISYVGSSNLSVSGLNLNTELNVAVSGDDNHQALSDWFRERWEVSTDFNDLAREALEKSWVLINEVHPDEVTPFRVYLRILHEIFFYQETEEIKKEKKYGEVELYDYQVDAVRDAYHKLQYYNGVFLADVPGVGKTYTGSALLAHLEEEGKRALVICPPKLQEQWQEVLADFGVGTARVFSLGKLEDILDNERLMEREVILVDEAHHFRNPNTFRYEDLQLICEGKKVILVGATPQNLSVFDLYHQMKLFVPDDLDHNFRINPPDLKEFFRECKNGGADLEDLISQIVVRRTRSDIREYYRKIEFPERKGPYREDYNIDRVYPGGLYRLLNQLLSELKFARYDIGSYLKPKNDFSPDQVQRLKQAGANLKGIMSIILFRRLESSIPAFRETTSWMAKSHSLFLKALDENKVLVGEEAEKVIDDLKAGEEIEDIEIPETLYDAGSFEKERMRKDIEEDKIRFEKMYNSVKDLGADNDEKLAKLISLLKSPEITGKKAIIFTQFSATARYLGTELAKLFPKVDCASQDTGHVLTKVKRFAPRANKYRIKPGEEIDILVSTDLLSEGLNLQDGQVVVNYELHWNPVRIIQRIGRIDRIGSQHDTIYIHNFFPQEEVEERINVETKVKKRINEIIKHFGGDEKTISMDEETVRKKLFEVYTENSRSLEEEEARSRSGHFMMEWKKLKAGYPEEYRQALKLPTMVTCGMPAKKLEGIAIFCRSDDYYKLLLSDQTGSIVENNDWKIMELIECTPRIKSVPLLGYHLNVLEKVRKNFEDEVNRRETKKQELEEIKKQVIKRLDQIKRGKTEKVKKEVEEIEEKLRRAKLNLTQRRALRKEIRKYGARPEETVEQIKKIIMSADLETDKPLEKKYAQVIISESLT